MRVENRRAERAAMAERGEQALPLVDQLRRLPAAKRLPIVTRLGVRGLALAGQHWRALARPEQLPPEGDWRIWFIMAGRGFGKTRSGAEWIDALARADDGLRIALVGASFDDVRNVMIEGESGILACARDRKQPIWAPALRRLVWPGGAMARCYSAAEPEGLRGPAHHLAWADEVARWDASADGSAGGGSAGSANRSRGEMAWDNLMMGLRLGERPMLCATTTPRSVPLVRRILAMPGVAVSGGPTHANRANLSDMFVESMERQYGDTAYGRQEIGGELIEDIEGALWSRALLESCRVSFPTSSGGLCSSGTPLALRPQADAADVIRPFGDEALERVVIGVDPPASSTGDACGIVVCGSLTHPIEGTVEAEYLVLEDATVEKASPERWARAVAEAAMRWGADRIVAEANNGGEMVRRVLEAEDVALPVVLVHARGSKAARAEPVAIQYQRGRVAHAGRFPKLEDEMCGLIPGGGYAGPGRSPDRADALVWALGELMAARSRSGPRVRRL
jgi:phage terminase large subunit-like protein